MLAPGRSQEPREIGIRHVAARQNGAGGPGAAREAHDRLQLFQRVLGELAVGRDLAAEDREQRRPAGVGVEVEDIVAGDGRGVAAGIVVERAHAGIGPDHVGRGDLALEVAVDHPAQIVGLVGRDRGRGRIALVGHVGGADQAELALERDHEHDPLVVVLQDVGMLARIEPGHDDVRALDQPHALGRVHAQRPAEEARHPGAGRVDQGAGARPARGARCRRPDPRASRRRRDGRDRTGSGCGSRRRARPRPWR